MITKENTAGTVEIWIAGEISVIENYLRKRFMQKGNCVTVTPTRYIYTGGQEEGCVIGFRNYPRFPKKLNELIDEALTIAKGLLSEASQWSCMVTTPHTNYWLSNRPENDKGPNE